MKKNGFTLIELVVVIIILGILAVTAAPKFIDLGSDARKSVMQSLKGSLSDAVKMAHAKALISNKMGSSDSLIISGKHYGLRYGYPDFVIYGDGSTSDKALAVNSLIELDSDTDITYDDSASPAVFDYSSAPTPERCRVKYFRAASLTTPAIIETDFSGC
ncbi:type II secretion system protein [Shewanella kaireitica]|uniref:type II secretion system protein n=1 Tax=Shewanella kaireitica TaxID=212021 RepID=UPI0024B1E87D|nr:prepilin-type N-terminal cleavage/methylation domain-containing protein [Shewanella kaireitica]